MLSDLATPKSFVLAQGDNVVPVHFVRQEETSARSVCGLQPEPEWRRVWREALTLGEMPDGVCRECWHSTRFAETFEAALH
jgi:hypothetical protein